MARSTPEIPNASMADIAFLLLTFFLMTTTVASDKGLLTQLPPPPEALPPDMDIEIPERNLFKVQVNSFDKLLVEGEPWTATPAELTEKVKAFILNRGSDPASSDNPQKAIVSLKTDRGTSHKIFIEVLDALTAAYYEIYAERAGVSAARWREISSEPNKDELNKQLYDKGRGVLPNGQIEIPKNISIAEPTKIGG
jgi:biopolymer transport protein ExbD